MRETSTPASPTPGGRGGRVVTAMSMTAAKPAATVEVALVPPRPNAAPAGVVVAVDEDLVADKPADQVEPASLPCMSRSPGTHTVSSGAPVAPPPQRHEHLHRGEAGWAPRHPVTSPDGVNGDGYRGATAHSCLACVFVRWGSGCGKDRAYRSRLSQK